MRYLTIWILSQIAKILGFYMYHTNKNKIIPNRHPADPNNPEHWVPACDSDYYQKCCIYPQTWGLAHRFGKRGSRGRRLVEWMCGKLIGHEISKTEFGYGGGDMADYNCRWCDKVIQMPLREETDSFNRGLADLLGEDK